MAVNCEECGAPIVGRRNDARFCTLSCATSAYNRKRREHRKPPPAERACAECGQVYRPKQDKRAARYCSIRCANNAYNRRRATEIEPTLATVLCSRWPHQGQPQAGMY